MISADDVLLLTDQRPVCMELEFHICGTAPPVAIKAVERKLEGDRITLSVDFGDIKRAVLAHYDWIDPEKLGVWLAWEIMDVLPGKLERATDEFLTKTSVTIFEQAVLRSDEELQRLIAESGHAAIVRASTYKRVMHEQEIFQDNQDLRRPVHMRGSRKMMHRDRTREYHRGNYRWQQVFSRYFRMIKYTCCAEKQHQRNMRMFVARFNDGKKRNWHERPLIDDLCGRLEFRVSKPANWRGDRGEFWHNGVHGLGKPPPSIAAAARTIRIYRSWRRRELIAKYERRRQERAEAKQRAEERRQVEEAKRLAERKKIYTRKVNERALLRALHELNIVSPEDIT